MVFLMAAKMVAVKVDELVGLRGCRQVDEMVCWLEMDLVGMKVEQMVDQSEEMTEQMKAVQMVEMKVAQMEYGLVVKLEMWLG